MKGEENLKRNLNDLLGVLRLREEGWVNLNTIQLKRIANRIVCLEEILE